MVQLQVTACRSAVNKETDWTPGSPEGGVDVKAAEAAAAGRATLTPECILSALDTREGHESNEKAQLTHVRETSLQRHSRTCSP